MAEHTPTPWMELTYPNSTNIELAAAALPTIALIRMGWGGGAHGSVTKEEAIANMAFVLKAVNMHQELVEALQLARFAVLGYIDRCDYSRGREVLLKMQTALANAGIDTSKWYIPTAALDELRKPVDEVRE